MQGASVINFPEAMRLRTPKGMQEALTLAARFRNTTTAEYARQAILSTLAADGVRLRDGRIEGRPG